MQPPSWTDFLLCSVCMNEYNCSAVLPVSLSCGHALCKNCLQKLKASSCPYDRTPISQNADLLPLNTAILLILGFQPEHWQHEQVDPSTDWLPEKEIKCFSEGRESVEALALFLKPYIKSGIVQASAAITRPMLKKLVMLVNCQIVEIEGRTKAIRAASSIAERTITELLVMHQNQQQISTLLWTAVRQRGCQFLGTIMQEEALKLILKVLESGRFLSRKNIVLYVVQQLQQDFPNASKTNIGHVVQLLYRASCFNVEKREDDSSLMQLKEEYRTYESLRREHDAQIIKIAMEAGLRISPEQWSTLLYGNPKRKSDMQSIIDKLIAQGAAASGLSELIVAIRRSQDPYNLSEKIVPHLEVLLRVGIVGADKEPATWQQFSMCMIALLATLKVFTEFMQIQMSRNKTMLCPALSKPEGCSKVPLCPYSHTEEERKRFIGIAQNKVRRPRQPRPNSGSHSVRLPPTMPAQGRWSGEHPLGGDSSLEPVSGQGSFPGLVYHPSSDPQALLMQSIPLVNAAPSGIGAPSGYVQRYSAGLNQPSPLGISDQQLYEQGMVAPQHSEYRVDPKTTPYPIFPGYDSTANPPTHLYVEECAYSAHPPPSADSFSSFESSGSASGSIPSQLYPKGYQQPPGRSELVDSVGGVSYSQQSAVEWEGSSTVPPATTTATTLSGTASSSQYQPGELNDDTAGTTSVNHNSQSATSHDMYISTTADELPVEEKVSSGTIDSASSASSQDFMMRELQKRVQALELELERSKKSQNQVQELPQQTIAQFNAPGTSYSPQATAVVGRSAFSAPVPVHHNHSGQQAILSHTMTGHTPAAYYHPSQVAGGHWSGLVGVSPQTTPPSTGLLLSSLPGGQVLQQPTAALMQERYTQEQTDQMLAHYLQALEQAKANPMALHHQPTIPSHHPHIQHTAAPPTLEAYHLNPQRGFNYPLPSHQLRAPYTYRPS